MTFTANWYGLFIGLGIVVALELIERKARLFKFDVKYLRQVLLIGLVAGVIGSRAWHVATDFSLYQEDLLSMLFFWQGGLSILGGILGGIVGVYGVTRLLQREGKLSFTTVLDLLVFGVPFGQAIGRWGNWVNQELYGTPTALPWGIAIAPENRVAEFASNSTFHPLFLYESLLLIIFGGFVWILSARKSSEGSSEDWKVGSGSYAFAYLLFYSVVRFFLEFLRVQKAPSVFEFLSVNQVALLVVVAVVLVCWRQKIPAKLRRGVVGGFILGSCILLIVLFRGSPGQGLGFEHWKTAQIDSRQTDTAQSGVQYALSTKETLTELRVARDHELRTVRIGNTTLEVEVVTSARGITQGLSGRKELGAEGMLFVFPSAREALFWMPEMQFDLDIIWISQGLVQEVEKNVPKPVAGAALNELPRYPSPGKVELVLEVPAGKTDEWGIGSGTAVFLEQFK
jgi:phosphatidylglycerol---prolipoprotein diacylglyceryl transferase